MHRGPAHLFGSLFRPSPLDEHPRHTHLFLGRRSCLPSCGFILWGRPFLLSRVFTRGIVFHCKTRERSAFAMDARTQARMNGCGWVRACEWACARARVCVCARVRVSERAPVHVCEPDRAGKQQEAPLTRPSRRRSSSVEPKWAQDSQGSSTNPQPWQRNVDQLLVLCCADCGTCLLTFFSLFLAGFF